MARLFFDGLAEIMSWQGYLDWLQKKKENFQEKFRHSSWEAKDIAETVLFSLLRTFELAKSKGCAATWSEFETFFKKGLEELEKMENSAATDWLYDNSSSAVSSDSEEGKETFASAKADLKNKDYELALNKLTQLYDYGQRDFHVVKYILESYEKQNRLLESADFLSKALIENQFSHKEQAQLYFKLGLLYFKLGKYTQSRQAFWQLKKIFPNFPGLDEKLNELEKNRKRARSKFDYLLSQNILSKEQLDQASASAKKQKTDLLSVLIKDYSVPKESLGKSLSDFYDVAFIPFDPKVEPPFEIFEKRRLDPEFLKKYTWVPFRQKENTIEVLMVNPFDLGKIDEIRFILGTSQVEPKVSLKQDIDAFIDHFFKELQGGEELTDFDEQVDSDYEEEDVADLEEAITEQDSEVVRLVNALLVEAWKRGASDIHIEPNTVSKYCAIRFRVDGTCHEFRKVRFSLSRPLVSRIKIMSRLDIAERRLPQDGKVKLRLPNVNKNVEFRVATMPTIDAQEDVVLRVLASGKPLSLEDLGLAHGNMESFKEMIYQPYGMILVVGPTGSGKTTTLHSSLYYINTPEKKIWTAEDPVEITQEGLRQVQVNQKIGLTFAFALRSFLRADPDVIMIGEMRDKETAHIGVEASLTGHVVFSTLHTNSAPETITRLLDMELDPFNFADSLLCVLAQRLVKTLCPNCKEKYKPSKEELEELKSEFGSGWETAFDEDFLKNPVLYRPKGCRMCMGGYKGRVGIHELMLNSDNIKHLIKFRKPTEELRQQAKNDGMLTLKQDGILKVTKGITDIQQIRTVAGKN